MNAAEFTLEVFGGYRHDERLEGIREARRPKDPSPERALAAELRDCISHLFSALEACATPEEISEAAKKFLDETSSDENIEYGAMNRHFLNFVVTPKLASLGDKISEKVMTAMKNIAKQHCCDELGQDQDDEFAISIINFCSNLVNILSNSDLSEENIITLFQEALKLHSDGEGLLPGNGDGNIGLSSLSHTLRSMVTIFQDKGIAGVKEYVIAVELQPSSED